MTSKITFAEIKSLAKEKEKKGEAILDPDGFPMYEKIDGVWGSWDCEQETWRKLHP